LHVSRRTARGLVYAAFAGQVVFIASWIVAGALQPGYSSLHRGISYLGAGDGAHPWIVDAGLVVFGLSIGAVGLALLRALPRRQAATVAAGLFAAAGLAIVLSGVFTPDCGAGAHFARCRSLDHAGALSWHHYAHMWLALAAQVGVTLTPFAIARALWPGPVAFGALLSGVSAIEIGFVSWLLFGAGGAPDGLVQRIGIGFIHLWVLIVGIGILFATRGPRWRSDLIPLRPREFFARTWTGDGELIGWPHFLWRRFPQRFEAHREAVWISETLWRFDDEARFGPGSSQKRQTFCEFVTPDHVRLTARDLPDGADVWIEEGGYRLSEFRLNFRFGPIGIPMLVRERSRFAPDGTFLNIFDARFRWIPLPLGRVVFRVRPEEESARAQEARADNVVA
jgi:hypothetical protein